MLTFKNRIFKVSLVGIILLLTAWFIKEFNIPKIIISEGGAGVSINFILPMNKEKFNDRISIIPDIPNTDFECITKWESANKVSINIKEKSEVKGQKIHLLIKNAETILPFIKKNANIAIQFQQSPQVLRVSKYKDIPTDEPIIVEFNTPMQRANINKYIESDAEFEIMPIEGSGNSKWRFTPKEKLANNKKYILYIRKGMPSISNMVLEEDTIISLETAHKPEITKILPENNERWVGIYPVIRLESNEPIREATIEIAGEIVEGKIIEGMQAEFMLPMVLDFETNYNAVARLISSHGEKSDPYEFNFSTIPLDEDRLWIEVILKEEHKVIVYRGRKPIRVMPCSGGAPETPTVLGTYYLKDRGKMFFARKISEGANNWIRIHGNYLFHGLPRNKDWEISKEAEAKLGLPASHGCVRLREVDAKWFYDNIPENTMVIIHE